MASTGALVYPPPQARRQFRAFSCRVVQGRAFIALCPTSEAALALASTLNGTLGWDRAQVVSSPRALAPVAMAT